MAFPIWVIDDCIITLAIHESKVEDLAKALFNVQVELRGQVRSLILPGGVKVAPSPELTVKGVACGALLDVFGPEIYKAVIASNMREQEVADRVNVLQCVSIILPASSRDTVIINLTLETLRAI